MDVKVLRQPPKKDLLFLIIGSLFWFAGFSIEVIADMQKRQFKKEHKEGFISSTFTTDFFIPTFQACRAQGYSREFCVQTPEEGSPGSCICGDGRRGKFLVGYRGQCVCDDHNPYQLSY